MGRETQLAARLYEEDDLKVQ